jgi:chromate reductase
VAPLGQQCGPTDAVQSRPGLIDGDGQVTDASMKEFPRKYATEFHAFIVRVTTVLPKDS